MNRVSRIAGGLSERILQHELPGVEFEQQLDRPIAEIDKGAARPKANVLHRQDLRRETRLSRAILEVGDEAAIFLTARHTGQVQRTFLRHPRELRDQLSHGGN